MRTTFQLSGCGEQEIEKAHERKAIADLMFDLVVGQIIELLQHNHLEHHYLVPRLAPGLAFACRVGFAPERLQLRPKILPRDGLLQKHQRIVFPVQTRISVRKVEKAHLPHEMPPLPNQFRLSENSR